MYIPPAFAIGDLSSLHAAIRQSRLANVITATAEGLMASPLPLLLDPSEGDYGVLYGHLARANRQWTAVPNGEALAVFMGSDAYVTPAWYQAKRETGKVVPTWNYVTVHAYGEIAFFDDAARLLDVVTRLTNAHEGKRKAPWAVSDAPAPFIQAQLRGIVGLRMPITRLEGKRKLSQNRSAEDQARVAAELGASPDAADQALAMLMRE
jgi:transcriptional regulator